MDELVEDVVKKLEENGELDNTYIFYTGTFPCFSTASHPYFDTAHPALTQLYTLLRYSLTTLLRYSLTPLLHSLTSADNGFALGTHRRQPGKTLGYEEDITVPFVVRGPKVPKGKTDTLSSYGIVDLSRTILDIAGAKPDYLDDGVVINLHNDDDDSKQAQHALARHSLSEFWVYGIEEGIYAGVFRENSTYRTLRYHDEGATQLTYSYSVWCTGERELYDLKADPYQLNNLLGELNDQGPFAAFDSLPADVQRATNRLDAVTLVLKTCEGEACGNPWDTLFAGGKVSTLAEALKPEYDEYFVSLPKVHFDECALGYQARREEPLWQDEWAFKPSNGGAKAAEDKKQKVLVHDEI